MSCGEQKRNGEETKIAELTWKSVEKRIREMKRSGGERLGEDEIRYGWDTR